MLFLAREFGLALAFETCACVTCRGRSAAYRLYCETHSKECIVAIQQGRVTGGDAQPDPAVLNDKSI